MSKTALIIVAAIIVIVVLYRRGLARKKIASDATFEAELQELNAGPSRGAGYPSESASEILTGTTREIYTQAKIVNVQTGETSEASTARTPRSLPTGYAGSSVAAGRNAVAAMLPVVHSSPTATRGSYRTAL